MNDELFEKRLTELPRRAVPEDWRAKILAAAQVRPARKQVFSLVPLLTALRGLIWPHPYAWGGVAAVWVVIAGLHFSGPRGEQLYAVVPKDRKGMEISTERYVEYLRMNREFLARSDREMRSRFVLEPYKL